MCIPSTSRPITWSRSQVLLLGDTSRCGVLSAINAEDAALLGLKLDGKPQGLPASLASAWLERQLRLLDISGFTADG